MLPVFMGRIWVLISVLIFIIGFLFSLDLFCSTSDFPNWVFDLFLRAVLAEPTDFDVQPFSDAQC